MTWFTNERIGWIAALVLVAGMGYGVGEGQHNQEFVNAKVAPVVAHDKADHEALKTVTAHLDCEHNRANIATAAAVGAGISPTAIPNCPAIPPKVLKQASAPPPVAPPE